MSDVGCVCPPLEACGNALAVRAAGLYVRKAVSDKAKRKEQIKLLCDTGQGQRRSKEKVERASGPPSCPVTWAPP